MSVWLTIPSARPPEECAPLFAKWRERGYQIALWCDSGADFSAKQPDAGHVARYPGYAAAVNSLIRRLIANSNPAQAEWFVVAGDDVEPDLNHTADEIAAECRLHFEGNAHRLPAPIPRLFADEFRTWGVMQPTGDRWGDEPWSRQKWPDAPAYIDRVLGSAWYGREYCRRMYGGKGPLFDGYFHMFEDEEAQEVAKKMGVLWQRRDLIQVHNHWMRKTPLAVECPPHLQKVSVGPSGERHWRESQALFLARKAQGFPGHSPIP